MNKLISAVIGCLFIVDSSASVIKGSIDTAKRADKIEPTIYGQFTEHLGYGVYDGVWVGENSEIPNTRGIRNDVVAALRELKVPVVRWPGGCFADEYHWQDGIGPRERRPVRKNNWWGGVVETNAFGTHEFFDFAEQIGAKTYLSVNVASSNPTEMREWIEYLTSDEPDTLANMRRGNGRETPFSLDYIGIGNESWGCGGAMRPEYYSDLYRRFAAFLHRNGRGFHNNNDNKALAVASGANNLDTNWTHVVTSNAGSMMDAISLHFYTLNNGEWPTRNELTATDITQESWNEIVYQASRMDDVLSAHEAVLEFNDPDNKIALYVDEWGTWYRPEIGNEPSFLFQQNTLRDAITASVTLNIFHKHTRRVKMANIAQTVNVLQAMLLTDGAKMAKTPTYHVFKMYLPFQNALPVKMDLKSPSRSHKEGNFDLVSGSAAIKDDGTVMIALTNADFGNGHSLNINLGKNYAINSAKILTHQQANAHNIPGENPMLEPFDYNGFVVLNEQLEVDLPAKSVLVLQLAPQ
jgi:alpha-N-arabinofuranosidase